MNEKLSKPDMAMHDSRTRRASRENPADTEEKEMLKSEEFRGLMYSLGIAVNAAIGHLTAELEQLNQGKDPGSAAQLICRGATLCVVSQAFDMLQAAVKQKRKIPLHRLEKISRIVVDQRREERQARKVDKEGPATTSSKTHSLPDRDQMDEMVWEIYGAKLPPGAKQPEDHPPENPDGSSTPGTEANSQTPPPAEA